MDETVLPPKLISKLSSAADTLRGFDFIHVFSHYDADGVSAAAILTCMLERMGKEYQVTTVPVLNDDSFKLIQNSTAECLLLSDIGASYIPKLEELGKTVIVLDHHRSDYDSDKVIYANPHLYGIDGMTSGCGASMSFLLAVNVSEDNWDLSQLAFAGMAGDRQHINGLSGLNSYIFNGADRRGFVRKIAGSLIPSGPLAKSMFLSTDPFVKGVSGDHGGVSKIMSDAGISNGKQFIDLDENERCKLSSLMAVRLALQGVSLKSMEEVCRDRYYLTGYKTDAESLADIFNSTGRVELGSIAIGYALGNEDCLLQAIDINDSSRSKMIEAAVKLCDLGLTELENIQYFDSSSTGFTGMLCGIAMQ